MKRRSNLAVLGSLLAAMALTACSPTMVTQDNPKDGTLVTLVPDQTLRVRLTNQGDNAWRLEEGALKAVKPVTAMKRPSAGGALELALFDFVAAAPGQDQLTFTYRPDGALPSPADERITIKVAVGG